MIIARIEDKPFITGERLLRVMSYVFDARHLTLHDGSGLDCDYILSVNPPHDPPFSVSQLKNGQLSVDGTETQDARVAAAVATALDTNSPRVIALMDDGSKYIDLHPGMTADDVFSGWLDIESGDFDAQSDEQCGPDT